MGQTKVSCLFVLFSLEYGKRCILHYWTMQRVHQQHHHRVPIWPNGIIELYREKTKAAQTTWDKYAECHKLTSIAIHVVLSHLVVLSFNNAKLTRANLKKLKARQNQTTKHHPSSVWPTRRIARIWFCGSSQFLLPWAPAPSVFRYWSAYVRHKGGFLRPDIWKMDLSGFRRFFPNW